MRCFFVVCVRNPRCGVRACGCNCAMQDGRLYTAKHFWVVHVSLMEMGICSKRGGINPCCSTGHEIPVRKGVCRSKELGSDGGLRVFSACVLAPCTRRGVPDRAIRSISRSFSRFGNSESAWRASRCLSGTGQNYCTHFYVRGIGRRKKNVRDAECAATLLSSYSAGRATRIGGLRYHLR